MLAALSLTFLLAGTTAPPAAPAKPVSSQILTACAAVTRADVEELLGRQVGRGQEEMQPQGSTCDYTGTHGMVSISVQRLPGSVDLDADLQAMRAALPGSTLRNITGFGVPAFFLDIPGGGTQLHILQAPQRHLMISVLGFGEASAVSPAAERIARRTLARF